VNGREWPLLLSVGLGVVVLVNASFVWLALSTQPDIEPSYTQAARR
jgi:hypothetical protein